MAQFRAVIRGQRGEASRLGSVKSGIHADVNGWISGVSVHGRVDADGKDVFGIYATGGSNGGQKEVRVGHVILDAGAVVFVPAIQRGID